MWKKFRDLKIGDVIDLADGGTAKVLSCPGPTMARRLLGVEIRVTDGALEWCAQRPDADVFVTMGSQGAQGMKRNTDAPRTGKI